MRFATSRSEYGYHFASDLRLRRDLPDRQSSQPFTNEGYGSSMAVIGLPCMLPMREYHRFPTAQMLHSPSFCAVQPRFCVHIIAIVMVCGQSARTSTAPLKSPNHLSRMPRRAIAYAPIPRHQACLHNLATGISARIFSLRTLLHLSPWSTFSPLRVCPPKLPKFPKQPWFKGSAVSCHIANIQCDH